MTWTKQHDIELVKAYLGYEVNTPSPSGIVYCVDGNGKTPRCPTCGRWATDGYLIAWTRGCECGRSTGELGWN